MSNIQKLTPHISWVGANDRRLERFENLLPLTNGVSYNAYFIDDEKTALLDTVDAEVGRQLEDNLRLSLDGRDLDYLVITHMEPDHGANIDTIVRLFPQVKIVGNAKIFQMINQFFGTAYEEHYLEVKENETLELGKHTLQFIFAPMVHWPEVMFVYEQSEQILFSADAFGTFEALSGNLFDDETDYLGVYLDEARRYYANIVGKYGMPVQNALKKVADLPIKMIASLHGPVLRGHIDLMLEKYQLWSTYEPEEKGVLVAYGSMYGHTADAANQLARMLASRGVENIRVYDVSKTDTSYLIAEVFKYSHLVLAAPTYNLEIYPRMDYFIRDMGALNLRNRHFSVMGNGTWAPQAGKKITEAMTALPGMEQVGETLEITSKLHADQLPELNALADAIVQSLA